MEWYYILLVIFGILLFLFFCPLFFKMKFHIDVFNDFGKISIFLFGIKIKTINFVLTEKEVHFIFQNIIKQKLLDLKKIKFISSFSGALFAQTRIFSLQIFGEYGNKNNAQQTALANGIFMILMNFFTIFLHTKKQTHTNFGLKASFNEDALKFFGQTSFCFVLFSVLISYLIAKHKEAKNGK